MTDVVILLTNGERVTGYAADDLPRALEVLVASDEDDLVEWIRIYGNSDDVSTYVRTSQIAAIRVG